MYSWAENHMKLAHSRAHLKTQGNPETEESVMSEYIRRGGRVVHPETGEIVDNNTGADIGPDGQVVQRHPEAYVKRIPELIAAHKKAVASGSESVVNTTTTKAVPKTAKK